MLEEVFIKKNFKFIYFILETFGTPYGNNAKIIKRDVSIIGKTVKINSGPMKTYTGIVKDATEASVRVELHSIPKVLL